MPKRARAWEVSIPVKARRKRPRSFRNAPRIQEWTSGTAGEWLKRWEAAVPYAAARFAKAMREQTEVVIDKYIESLKRRLILNSKRRERRPGA